MVHRNVGIAADTVLGTIPASGAAVIVHIGLWHTTLPVVRPRRIALCYFEESAMDLVFAIRMECSKGYRLWHRHEPESPRTTTVAFQRNMTIKDVVGAVNARKVFKQIRIDCRIRQVPNV